MKALLVAAVVILAGTFAQAEGSDNGGWGQIVAAQSAAAPKKAAAPCVDGDRRTFMESKATAKGGDGLVQVVRTCENGRWYPKSTATILACTEGRVILQSLPQDNYRDNLVQVPFVCKNGKYVRAN